MAKVAITEQYLEDIADAIREKTGLSTATYLPSEMAPAILTISGGGGITPTGTLNITSNGTYNVTQYASAAVAVPTGPAVNNQDKSVTPTESAQTVTYDSGYTGLGTVSVGAISSSYVGTGIARKDSSDLVVNGNSITVPAGYYSADASSAVSSMTLPTSAAASATSGFASKATISRSTSDQYINIPIGYNSTGVYYKVSAVPNGTAGTPTATKGTVSNHSISVTPSVTNTTGYITGSTKNGTAVSVSASELVSGTKSITSNGTSIDVTNYAAVDVAVPTGGTVNNQDKSVIPTESEQEVTYDSGYTGLGTVTVGAISSTYVGSGIARNDSSDLIVSTSHIGIPAGYYAEDVIGSVDIGSVTGPTSLSGSSATISTDTNTITLTKTGIATTPTVSAGYVSSATSSTATVALTASVAVNPTPTASGKTVTIPVGYYTTQTTKDVATGSATVPATISGTSASVSTGTNTITLSKTISVTPTVSAGYISSGTAGNSSVSLTASVTTKAATTYHPSATAQSISSSTYLTGVQTIAAVTTSNLSASNIVSGVTIKVGDSSDDDCVASVTGNVVLQNYYTGSSAPSSSLGSNGDLYLQS